MVATQNPTSAVPYPRALADLLQMRFGLEAEDEGAVVCNGSGRLAQLFLRHGRAITLVEQDAALRESLHALVDSLPGERGGRHPKVRLVQGTPQATGLPTASLDFLVSDRVLFTPELLQVRREFARVLRPGSPVALVTDNRVYSGGSQAQEYDELLRAGCPGFREKRSPYDVRAAVASFFQGGSVYEDAFISEQVLTLDQLRAQTAALPIYPAQDATRMAQLDEALTSYFHRWALEDELTLPTICRVAVGCLAG